MTEHARDPVVDRRCLHLLVQGVSDHDVAKLTAFLRLGADRLGCDWKMVQRGHAHVLLHGGDEPATVLGLLDDPVEIRRIAESGAAESSHGSALTRPLQYEAVIETLLAAERKCGVVAVPEALPATTLPALASTSSAALQAGARYRLRRWPSAELVQRSRDHLRVASFLSARHAGIAELARLANVEPARCEEIVGALMAFGYLDAQTAAPPAAVATARVATEPAARPGPGAAADAGLFARIRRKFGLRGAT